MDLTLGVGKVNDLAIIFEHIHLLNAWDCIHAKLLQGCLAMKEENNWWGGDRRELHVITLYPICLSEQGAGGQDDNIANSNKCLMAHIIYGLPSKSEMRMARKNVKWSYVPFWCFDVNEMGRSSLFACFNSKVVVALFNSYIIVYGANTCKEQDVQSQSSRRFQNSLWKLNVLCLLKVFHLRIAFMR